MTSLILWRIIRLINFAHRLKSKGEAVIPNGRNCSNYYHMSLPTSSRILTNRFGRWVCNGKRPQSPFYWVCSPIPVVWFFALHRQQMGSQGYPTPLRWCRWPRVLLDETNGEYTTDLSDEALAPGRATRKWTQLGWYRDDETILGCPLVEVFSKGFRRLADWGKTLARRELERLNIIDLGTVLNTIDECYQLVDKRPRS